MSNWHDVWELIKEKPMAVVITIDRPVIRHEITLDGVVGMGEARCAPCDEWNEALGRAIAKGRAQKALALAYPKRDPATALGVELALLSLALDVWLKPMAAMAQASKEGTP